MLPTTRVGGVVRPVALLTLAGVLTLLALISLASSPPGSKTDFKAVGKGYCRDETGEWDKASHHSECDISQEDCAAKCTASSNCQGFAHTTIDTMGMCKDTHMRCVVYEGESAVVSTHLTTVHHNEDYTCYALVSR